MKFTLSFSALAMLPIFVAAVPTDSSSCSTGSLQCCNSVQSASSADTSSLLGTLGINLQGLNVPIGLTCDPISVIGIGSNNCNAQAVCCENNSFGGLVSLGCTPVNLAL